LIEFRVWLKDLGIKKGKGFVKYYGGDLAIWFDGGFGFYKDDEYKIYFETGFRDIKGRKIYIGDIVSFIDGYDTEAGFFESGSTGVVKWDAETASIIVTDRLSAESYEVLEECEVIGNIYSDL
jgi:hypothetical protein